jgi:putative peptidoglycan lipid II flippase
VEKNYPQFRVSLRQGFSHLIFINVLSAVLLFTLAEPIIRLLFERGKFNAVSTDHVSFGLVCLAPGLISFSLVNILARAFYALNDIGTPMRISIFCLTINLLLTALFLFVAKLGAGALGVANSLSSFCNLALLLFALSRKLKTLEMAECTAQLPRLAVAGMAAGLLAWSLRWLWQKDMGHATLALKLGEVFLPMTAAAILYVALSWWMNISSAHEMMALIVARAKPS